MSKNENINKNVNSYEEIIAKMQEKMGIKFVENAKEILKNGKVLKGEDKKTNFNTELDEITYELEEIYPLNYEEFAKEFPNVIKNVERVKGSVVMKSVEKGLVIQGWSVRTNVDQIIENAKKNIDNESKRNEAIELANATYEECQRMKEEFGIEWCEDLFWKCYSIKEGQARWNYLVKMKGEKVAEKKIKSIRKQGGIEFIRALQDVIYPKED